VGEEADGVEGSSYGLRPGESRTVEDLLAGLLLRSGNDAAIVLAHAAAGSEQAFVLRMQEVLRRLGIEATLASASGLSDADALSAAELAIVSRAALAEPRIRDLVGVMQLEVLGVGTVENRNLFVGQFAGATGLKTGFTSAAGYTLSASAVRDGRELVAIVLGAQDDAARRATAARLLEYGFTETRQRSIGGAVTLRTSRGPVRFGTDDALVTVLNGAEARATWPTTLRPDDVPVAVAITVDGVSAGRALVLRRDARTEPAAPGGNAGLGSALVEGVYAALRPFGLTGALR
jgi:D-alanyl-D-alanine carboxypeptidase (penicillin-binding protein 5/6)